jgi:hypothetical protein
VDRREEWSVSAHELCVVFELAEFTCAVPARYVARLETIYEAELHQSAVPAGAPLALLGNVQVGGEAFAAWDLGALLQGPSANKAWVALRLDGPAGPVPIALRTGRCIGVMSVRPEMPLVSALFQARGQAFRGAFEVAVAGEPERRVAVLLDPSHLLETAELELSADVVAG